MKKLIKVCLLFAMILTISGCDSKTEDVIIADFNSNLYTQADYLSAVETVKTNFSKTVDGSKRTLREISYAGDEKTLAEQEYILSYGDYDEGIVLATTFDVGKSAGSLEPNSTYTGWQWFLGRKNGESWKIVMQGYG